MAYADKAGYGPSDSMITKQTQNQLNFQLPEPNRPLHTSLFQPPPSPCCHTYSIALQRKNLSALQEDSGCEKGRLLGRETPM